MAEIYKSFPGIPNSGSHGAYDDPLHYVFAHHRSVRVAVEGEALGRARVASSTLRAHRAEGHSDISVEGGSVDFTIWLTDRGEEGKYATNPMTPVYAIEFGREGGRGGARPLSTAFPEVT